MTKGRTTIRSPWVLIPCAAIAVACSNDPTNLDNRTATPAFTIIGGGGCPLPVLTGGVLPPIKADNSSSFQLGRTVPVKIRATDCVNGAAVNTLTPNISLALLGPGGEPVNEVISSSAADDGTTMRSAGDGQYIFNLSTKRSQFNAGEDLVSGVYQLTISSPGQFADVVVQFSIRP